MSSLETFNWLSDLKHSLNGKAVEIVTDVFQTIEKLNGCQTAYYRGLSDASWKLYTSAQRHWITNDRVRFAFGSFESFIDSYAKFLKTNCSADILNSLANKPNGNLTDFEAFSCAQHFGGPTPFLDFSKNAATALYFMSGGLERSTCGYGAIWKVDSSELKTGDYIKCIPYSTTDNRDMLDFEKFKELSQFWVQGAPIENHRSTLQSGRFLYRHGEESYEQERKSKLQIPPTQNSDPQAQELEAQNNVYISQLTESVLPEAIPVTKVYLFSSSTAGDVQEFLKINGINKGSLGLDTSDWAAEAYSQFLSESLKISGRIPEPLTPCRWHGAWKL